MADLLIRDCLQRDPSLNPLVNNGQARITNDTVDGRVLQELRGELQTFVCEGQYADGIQRILTSFLASQNQTSQKAAWVSGFFGSGKSHLLKMLCHLWRDTDFPDGATARTLVPHLPDEVRSLLRELDTAGKRSGGLLAAAGTLPSGTTDNVRLSVLSVLLRGVGLPSQYPEAQFCLWLEEQGYLDRVRARVESAGKQWDAELHNLYVSPLIAEGLLECDPDLAANPAEAKKTLRAQFPPKATDLTDDELLTMVKRVLKRASADARIPCTILVLDEVQQYIGDSVERSVLITDVAEAFSKQLDSQVILVGAGQSALSGTSLLNRLMDRFTIRVQLSDTDVETVTRKVLLQKKASARDDVKAVLEREAGEISRQLQGTKIGERLEDKQVIVEDYPLLPVRRRFWEHCFRQVDTAGTQSQLRSQLRIIYDSVARLADRPLGGVVPTDDLYEALAPEMVTTGALPREINERILAVGKDGQPEAELRKRICGLVFLIGQLPREVNDIGVRANKEHIADLLVDDLRADNGKLRSNVAALLDKLADDGTLMRVGEEYRIQTEEGRNWDEDFRRREARLKNDTTNFDEQRDLLFGAEIDKTVRSVKLIQGQAKEARSLVVHRGQDPPEVAGDAIPVWVRDQFSSSEAEVVNAARAAGGDSPILFVFIPRKSKDDLLGFISTAQAADETIHAKGAPATSEGQVARQSMESRRALAVQQRDDLVKDIISSAKVFQGGGNELLQLTLDARLETGANDSLARLFPRFKEADFSASAWSAAIKKARDGADQPFGSLNKYDGPIEQHPICQEILRTIGSGNTGTQIRKELRDSPFGWPRDAVDAALIALHRSQHITATLNGAPVALGQLDQNRIPKAEFRAEKTTLSVQDRIAIRKLFGELRVNAKSGEEAAKAPEFLAAAIALAREAGGPAPLPAPPSVTDLEDLQKLIGNEQLAAIRAKDSDIRARIKEWDKTKGLIAQRQGAWSNVEAMMRHAQGLGSAADALGEAQAIYAGRQLLEPSDPATQVRVALAQALRTALTEAHERHATAHQQGMASLDASDTWQALDAADRARILGDVGLIEPEKPDVSSDEALIRALDARSLTAREAQADAVSGRVSTALRRAAELLEPETQFVSLERTLLKTEEDVRGWLDRQEKKLIDALQDGPVQVQ
jgi:hypothetical protein